MTTRQKICTGLAGAHLLLVAYSTLPLPLPPSGNPAGDVLRWYGAMSGANNSYGFFKQVGCCFRVKFAMSDGVNEPWLDDLNRGFGQETQLRLNSGVNLIADFGEPLARQWAATMFGRHPDANQVYIQLEKFDPGTMAEYRDGMRPTWEVVDLKGYQRQGESFKSMEKKP